MKLVLRATGIYTSQVYDTIGSISKEYEVFWEMSHLGRSIHIDQVSTRGPCVSEALRKSFSTESQLMKVCQSLGAASRVDNILNQDSYTRSHLDLPT